jgi:hypothetical protein
MKKRIVSTCILFLLVGTSSLASAQVDTQKTAAVRADSPQMRLRACRLMRFQESLDKTLVEWWTEAGANENTIHRKLKSDRSLIRYFCDPYRWDPNGRYLRGLLYTGTSLDDQLVAQMASAGGRPLTDENRIEVTNTINEMQAAFLQLRMDGCGGLGDDEFSQIGDYLRGTNSHGMDVFGRVLPSVSRESVIPVAAEGAEFFDSRSSCSSGGGGGGVPGSGIPGSGAGALSCYMDTMEQGCADSPAPAFDITTALLSPSWVMDGAVDTADVETVSVNEYTRDTIMLAANTGYWIVSVASASGLAYTTVTGLAVGVGAIAMVGIALAVGTWSYYDKYLGEDRVDVGPRMCPLFSTSQGIPVSFLSSITGGPLGGVDAFMACADAECTGKFGSRALCAESQFRTGCQQDPQAFDQEKCTSLIRTDHASEWNRESFRNRYCSLMQCGTGLTSAPSGDGCACMEGPQGQGSTQLAKNPCWYSYCEDLFWIFRRGYAQ